MTETPNPSATPPEWLTEVKAQVLGFPVLQMSLQIQTLFQALPPEWQATLQTMDDERFYAYWTDNLDQILEKLKASLEGELIDVVTELATELPPPQRIIQPGNP